MDIDNSVWWDEIVVTLRVDLARGPDDANNKKNKGKDKDKDKGKSKKDKDKNNVDGTGSGTGTWEVGGHCTFCDFMTHLHVTLS